jgi:hypothetical protein
LSAEPTSHDRHVLFQPAVVLVISLVAAALLGLYMLRGSLASSSSLRFPPSFFYVVPIIIPFVAFLLDRAEHLRETTAVQVIVDVVVVGLAVARVFTSFPFVSGHTLFLTYAIGSSRSRVTVVTASMVMLQVIYLKYFVWHDLVTSTGGIILGTLATIVVRRVHTRRKELNHALHPARVRDQSFGA